MNTSWESQAAINTSLVVTVCPDNAMESSLWICIFGAVCARMIVSADYCRVLGQHVQNCTDTYNVDPLVAKGIPFFTDFADLQVFCSRVVDLLSCFHRKFDQCSVMYYDYSAYKDTFHKVCENVSFSISAYEACIDQTAQLIQTCIPEYRIRIIDLYKTSPDNNLQPEEQCSELRLCLQWTVTESCTSAYSSFLSQVFKRRFQPSLCHTIYASESIAPTDSTSTKVTLETDPASSSTKLTFSLCFFNVLFIIFII